MCIYIGLFRFPSKQFLEPIHSQLYWGKQISNDIQWSVLRSSKDLSCNYGNALHEASSHSFGDTFEDIPPKSESINNLAPLVARPWFRHLNPYANSTS